MPLVPPCICPKHTAVPYKPFTELLLQIWQREMFCKPYDTLVINQKHLETKLGRTLDQNDVDLLKDFLKKHQITSFEISYCDVSDLYLTDLICTMRHLTVICLINVNLCANYLKYMEEHANKFIIKALRLSGNSFTKHHAKYLHDFLMKNRTLEYLDVGFCNLTHTTFAIIADGVYHSRSLKGLDVSCIIAGNEYGLVDTEKIAALIAILIGQNKLEELHLRNNNFKGHDLDPIVEYLGQKNCLKYLDLSTNNIGAYGMQILMQNVKQGLINGNILTGLNISNNNIGKHGAEHLAHVLPFTKLRFLDISHNRIPANMMKFLLNTLRKPYDIKILNIYGNEFDDDCGRILKRYLDSNVLLINNVDIQVVFDEDQNKFIVISQSNDKTMHRNRYHRVYPFHRNFEYTLQKKWRHDSCVKIKSDVTFTDPILTDPFGNLYELNKKGQLNITKKIRSVKKFDDVKDCGAKMV